MRTAIGAWASTLFPFAIAVVFPPAGLLIGLTQLQNDREIAIRLIVVAALAAVIWLLLFL